MCIGRNIGPVGSGKGVMGLAFLTGDRAVWDDCHTYGIPQEIWARAQI